jgi:hypothetical protein
MSPF